MLQNHTLICLGMLCFLTSCCTLSFQNILTHGTASDLVDADASNDVKPETSLSIPAIGK